MTPGGRRASQHAVVRSLVGLSLFASACNLITGASELTPCETAQCADGELTVDGAPTVEGTGLDAATERAPVVDAASPDSPPDASGPETDAPCPECDAQVCSAANGPCEDATRCCNGLACNALGKCARSCIAEGNECVLATCCLGSRCSLAAGYVCVACGLAGTSCSNNAACCSNRCVSGSCVGNVAMSSEL